MENLHLDQEKSGKQTDNKICRQAFHLELEWCLLLQQLNYTIGFFLIHFSIICSVIVVTNAWCKIRIMFRSPSIHSTGDHWPTSSIQLHMLLSAGSITAAARVVYISIIRTICVGRSWASCYQHISVKFYLSEVSIKYLMCID